MAVARRLRSAFAFCSISAMRSGLRASEFVGATLGDIRRDEHGNHSLHVIGKDGKPGKAALPALDQFLGSVGHRSRRPAGTR